MEIYVHHLQEQLRVRVDIFYISVIICKCYNLITTIPSLLISDTHLEPTDMAVWGGQTGSSVLRPAVADGMWEMWERPLAKEPWWVWGGGGHSSWRGYSSDFKLRADLQVERTRYSMAVGGWKATFEKNTHRRLNTQTEIKYQDANRCINLSTGEKHASSRHSRMWVSVWKQWRFYMSGCTLTWLPRHLLE